MKYLWKSVAEIENKLDASRHILLLLDYDGTLVAIAETPDKARLPIATKKLLEKLKETKHIYLGIVSGRAMSDIKKRIGIKHIIYSGNHGLEWDLDNKKHMAAGIKRALQLLPEILGGLKVFEIIYKGVQIQNKNLVIGLHYRQLDSKHYRSFKKDFKAFIEPYIDSGIIKLLKGKKVYDITPNIQWGKGNFIDWLVSRRNPPPMTIFIGDDRTDEEAFIKLKDAVTIKVGKSKSAAVYYLDDHQDTIKFLEWVLKKKTDPDHVSKFVK